MLAIAPDNYRWWLRTGDRSGVCVQQKLTYAIALLNNVCDLLTITDSGWKASDRSGVCVQQKLTYAIERSLIR